MNRNLVEVENEREREREREASISSTCTVQAEHAGQDSKFCVGYTSACVNGSADIMVSRYA